MSESAQSNPAEGQVLDKGKGKAVEQHDMSMDEEDSSSDEETGEHEQEVPEEPDDDNMEEISTENIVGSRTRGKLVDYKRAAEEATDLPEDDEDDDDDFEEGDQEMEG